MADINSFAFTGRLGSDAQIKKTPNGKQYMEMSAAVNTGYGDYKKTLWVKVKQWGERTSNVAPIFTKGSLIGGVGELGVNEWSGKDGQMHTDIEITCMNINLLTKKSEAAAGTEPADDEEPVF